jgi:hypothetical protein
MFSGVSRMVITSSCSHSDGFVHINCCKHYGRLKQPKERELYVADFLDAMPVANRLRSLNFSKLATGFPGNFPSLCSSWDLK